MQSKISRKNLLSALSRLGIIALVIVQTLQMASAVLSPVEPAIPAYIRIGLRINQQRDLLMSRDTISTQGLSIGHFLPDQRGL
jgi:hypothetical protein